MGKKRIGCKTKGCNAPHYAHGVCQKHYDETRTRSEHDRQLHRDRSARRRAKLRGVFVESVNRQLVYERDRWRCALCGGEVDGSLKFPHPQSPSLDHIVPISKGGGHSYENVQLAHLRCNVGKGDRRVRQVMWRGARIIWIKAQSKEK